MTTVPDPRDNWIANVILDLADTIILNRGISLVQAFAVIDRLLDALETDDIPVIVAAGDWATRLTGLAEALRDGEAISMTDAYGRLRAVLAGVEERHTANDGQG